MQQQKRIEEKIRKIVNYYIDKYKNIYQYAHMAELADARELDFEHYNGNVINEWQLIR